jgi:Pyridoxamine 5'-phosphate oxidase
MSDSHPGTDQTPFPQGDLRLLGTGLAQELLAAPIPARLAFVWADGTPRVIPTWFHWTGTEIVMATYTAGPNIGIRHPASRLAALRARPRVALTIDTDGFPPRALTVRGDVEITELDGLVPEYTAAARRYLGEEAAAGMLAGLDQPGTAQARIALRPVWAGLLDFSSRLPSAQGGVLR